MTTDAKRTPFPASDTLVVTDGGLETWLVFERGVELPAFAAYPLVASTEGRALLTEYYEHYVAIAEHAGAALGAGGADVARQPGLGRDTRTRSSDAVPDDSCVGRRGARPSLSVDGRPAIRRRRGRRDHAATATRSTSP